MKHITHIPALPPRPKDGHKGTFGTVVVIGGCAKMIGAPALAARAAFRAGVGRVKLATPNDERDVLLNMMQLEPSATACAMNEALHEKAAFAIGPGLGDQQAIGSLLPRDRPTVLDADGLNALARHLPEVPRLPASLILTPHPGEFRRLAKPLGITQDPTNPDQRLSAAATLAEKLKAVVLLKGEKTIITDGTQYDVNTTGNVALAAAGSGDVLTGLIASLLAQGLSTFDAACLGAFTHGKAAEKYQQKTGRDFGLLARELADFLPQTLAEGIKS